VIWQEGSGLGKAFISLFAAAASFIVALEEGDSEVESEQVG